VTLIVVTVAVAVAAVAMMTGGDRNADAAKIRAVVRAYATASAAGDGRRVCALMTPKSRERFAATSAEQGCEAAIRALDTDRGAYRNLAVAAVDIDDETADVELSRFGDEPGGSLSLAERGDRWLLDFEGPGRAGPGDPE
jgi:hypothetical protein